MSLPRPRFPGGASPAASLIAAKPIAIAALAGVLVFGLLEFAALPVAKAQTVTVLNFRGQTDVALANLSDLQNGTPIGQSDCGQNIELRFTPVNNAITTLRLFWGSNCEDTAVRTDTTSTACPTITASDGSPLTIPTNSQNQVEGTVPIASLIDCTGSDGARTIFALGINAPGDDVAADQVFQFDLAFDLSPPAAPTFASTSPLQAESQVTVTWQNSEARVREHRVYVDEQLCPGGSAVADPTALVNGLTPSSTTMGTSTDVSLASSLAVGGFTGVAVRTIDTALNEGEVSAVRCIEKVQTVGFLEAVCADEPSACSGCAAVSLRSSGPGFGLVLTGCILGLLAVRRRRRG